MFFPFSRRYLAIIRIFNPIGMRFLIASIVTKMGKYSLLNSSQRHATVLDSFLMRTALTMHLEHQTKIRMAEFLYKTSRAPLALITNLRPSRKSIQRKLIQESGQKLIEPSTKSIREEMVGSIFQILQNIWSSLYKKAGTIDVKIWAMTRKIRMQLEISL